MKRHIFEIASPGGKRLAIGDRIDPKGGEAFGVESSCFRYGTAHWPASAIVHGGV
jgi:hypothetical protein